MDKSQQQPNDSNAAVEDFANYHPYHHAPHPPAEANGTTEAPDGQLNGGHGELHPETSEKLIGLHQRKPERKATGMKAVVSSFQFAWGEAGLDPSRLRVVLTRFDERRVIDKKLAEEAREAPEILIEARIRESVVVPESAAWQKPLIAFAPRHALTEDVRRVARELANA